MTDYFIDESLENILSEYVDANYDFDSTESRVAHLEQKVDDLENTLEQVLLFIEQQGFVEE